MKFVGSYFFSDRRKRWGGKIVAELGERGGYYLVMTADAFDERDIGTHRIMSIHDMRHWTFYGSHDAWDEARDTLEDLWSAEKGRGNENLERLEEFLQELLTLDVEHEITAQALLREWEEWKERKRLSQP